MNYLKELKAFRDWLLLNDLPTSAIALWHTLMSINNMTGWKERFNAPNSTVEKLTGLSKQGLVDARKRLIEKGLIEYEKGKKGKAPVYKICTLVNSLDLYSYQSNDQSSYQGTYQSNDQHLTIPKHKQDINKTGSSSSNTRTRAAAFFVQNFGNHSLYIQEKIADWEKALSEDIVIASMKIALEKNARNFSYCESILKEWFAEGLRTLDEVRAYELAKKDKRKINRSGASKNSMPRAFQSLQEWAEEEVL